MAAGTLSLCAVVAVGFSAGFTQAEELRVVIAAGTCVVPANCIVGVDRLPRVVRVARGAKRAAVTILHVATIMYKMKL